MQPPTYEVDGFTHATADPSFLIGVANHFYKTTQPEWICLGMTRASLAAAQITLKFEDPSPVGTTQALNQEQSGGQRFPVRMRPPLHRPNMDGDACMHAPAPLTITSAAHLPRRHPSTARNGRRLFGPRCYAPDPPVSLLIRSTSTAASRPPAASSSRSARYDARPTAPSSPSTVSSTAPRRPDGPRHQFRHSTRRSSRRPLCSLRVSSSGSAAASSAVLGST